MTKILNKTASGLGFRICDLFEMFSACDLIFNNDYVQKKIKQFYQ